MTDYESYDGLGLAELVRHGETSAGELLAAACARIERLNPQLNAVVTPLYDAARAAIAAGLPQGPFSGVPFLVKELVASVAGSATTAASTAAAQSAAPVESAGPVQAATSTLSLAALRSNTRHSRGVPAMTIAGIALIVILGAGALWRTRTRGR